MFYDQDNTRKIPVPQSRNKFQVISLLCGTGIVVLLLLSIRWYPRHKHFCKVIVIVLRSLKYNIKCYKKFKEQNCLDCLIQWSVLSSTQILRECFSKSVYQFIPLLRVPNQYPQFHSKSIWNLPKFLQPYVRNFVIKGKLLNLLVEKYS